MKAAKTTMPATQSGNAIVVYEPDETTRLDVRLENGRVQSLTGSDPSI